MLELRSIQQQYLFLSLERPNLVGFASSNFALPTSTVLQISVVALSNDCNRKSHAIIYQSLHK